MSIKWKGCTLHSTETITFESDPILVENAQHYMIMMVNVNKLTIE